MSSEGLRWQLKKKIDQGPLSRSFRKHRLPSDFNVAVGGVGVGVAKEFHVNKFRIMSLREI
jgi:hypothetical protein